MDDSTAPTDGLLQRGAQRLTGHQRRLFLAEVTLELCGGSARRAERRFGWGRETVAKGLHELRQDIRCLENFAARGRPRWEDQYPQLAAAHSSPIRSASLARWLGPIAIWARSFRSSLASRKDAALPA